MATGPARYTAVARGLTAVLRGAARKAKPYYPSLCTLQNSGGSDEGYAMLGGIKGMREWVGDRDFSQLTAADFVVKNRHFENSVEVEKTAIDDDRIGLYDTIVADLGEECACHPDELLFEEGIKSGETAECWDGQNFYDTDHVWRNSGVQSNIVTVDVADPSALTPEDFRKAYHLAIRRMMSFKRDNGKFWMRPKAGPIGNLTLNVPLAMQEVANKSFSQAISLEVSGGNAAATSNFVLETPNIHTMTYLGTESDNNGSDTDMYLQFTGGRLKPFLFQRRQQLRVVTEGVNSMEKMIKIGADVRYNLGFLMWMYSIKIKFT